MPFRMPVKTRRFFKDIYDKKNKDGMKLKLQFDGYYFSLLVGLASGMYDAEAELESSEFFDEYPQEYSESKEYIAALLIATEIQLQGIAEEDAEAMEQLMKDFIEPKSKTLLTSKGEQRLNQYAARGLDIMIEEFGDAPLELDIFLREYFDCFPKEQVKADS